MVLNTRKAVVAGYFYPSEPKQLKETINNFLNKATEIEISGDLKGLIVPHAGYIYSGSVAAVGYKLLKNFNKKKVILIGPSHFLPFIGASVSTADFWETPIGKVKVQKIKTDFFIDLPQAHLKEHSLEVQLPFLQLVLKDFNIIPIVLGEVDPKDIADALIPLLDKDTVIIASSDLSHYHPYNIAKKLDELANKFIPKLDIKNVEMKVEACGKTAILTLMNMAKKMKWVGKKLYYCNSGDVTGDKGQVVGYGCYAFYGK